MIVSLERENQALYFEPISESLFALLTKKILFLQCSSEVRKKRISPFDSLPLNYPNVMLSEFFFSITLSP